jgi:hypothetical protein
MLRGTLVVLIFDTIDLQLDNDLPRRGPANSFLSFYKKVWNQVSGRRTKQPWMYNPRAKVRIQTSEDGFGTMTVKRGPEHVFLGMHMVK